MDDVLKAVETYNDVISLSTTSIRQRSPELVLYGEAAISSAQDGNVTRLSAAHAKPAGVPFQITLAYDNTAIKE